MKGFLKNFVASWIQIITIMIRSFFNGNDELPRWAGYSLGYYLVKNILRKLVKRSKTLLLINMQI